MTEAMQKRAQAEAEENYALYGHSTDSRKHYMAGFHSGYRARSEEVEARAEGEFPPRKAFHEDNGEWYDCEDSVPLKNAPIEKYLSLAEHEALRAQDRAEVERLKAELADMKWEYDNACKFATDFENRLSAEREARKHDLARIQELRAALDKIANGDTSEMDGTGDGWLPKQVQYEKIAQHAIAKTKETADE